MESMKQMISSQNKTILESTKMKENKEKPATDKKSCPLKGQCLQKGVVYKATVEQKPWKKTLT